MTESTTTASATAANARRLRLASLLFNLCTLLIMITPNFAFRTMKDPGAWALFYALHASFIIGGWAIYVLARDPRLRVLMAFGSRRNRESVARPPNLLLDEFDFHLRGEAFRLSYQLVAALAAMVSIAGFLIQALTEIKVDWGKALMLTFPFGVLWLLALPTTIVVWLANPAPAD